MSGRVFLTSAAASALVSLTPNFFAAASSRPGVDVAEADQLEAAVLLESVGMMRAALAHAGDNDGVWWIELMGRLS